MNLNETGISLIVWAPLTESPWKLLHQQEAGHSTGIIRVSTVWCWCLSRKQIMNSCTVITERMVVSRMEELLRILNFTKNYCTKKLIFPYQENLTRVQVICVCRGWGLCFMWRLTKAFQSKQLTNERRVFNYRLSRARRVIENTFGIMTSRFWVFSYWNQFKIGENGNSCLVLLCSTQLFASLVQFVRCGRPGWIWRRAKWYFDPITTWTQQTCPWRWQSSKREVITLL